MFKRVFILSILLSFASISLASAIDNLSNFMPEKPELEVVEQKSLDDYPLIRQGGDNIGTATVIGAFPYSTTGSTSGYVNDYDAVCPYTGSTAPDVVYQFDGVTGMELDIDLAGSSYDTKVYVYDVALTVIGCNDDFYADYTSFLNVEIPANGTYYIIVDGYGAGSGTYLLNVEEFVPCIDDLTPVGDAEVEPNGGLNEDPVQFDPRPVGTAGAPTQITGTYFTYEDGGNNFRDMDWFNFTLTEPMIIDATVDVACTDPAIWVIDDATGGTDYIFFADDNGAEMGEVLTTDPLPPGDYWFLVAPTVFSGIETPVHYNAELWGTSVNLPPTIDHVPFPSTTVTTGTYDIVADITDEGGVANATLFYDINNSGTFTDVTMIDVTRETLTMQGSIPAQPGGTLIDYYIQATDNLGAITETPVFTFAVFLAQTVPFELDFEANNGGFFESLWPTDGSGGIWEWGAPTGPAGPMGGFESAHVWGTGLEDDYGYTGGTSGPYYPDGGGYLDNVRSSLTPNFLVDLAGLTEAYLKFDHWYWTESCCDGGNVKLSTDFGATWQVITPMDGYDGTLSGLDPVGSTSQGAFKGDSGGWVHEIFDLSAYAGTRAQIMIRFDFKTDSSWNSWPGWFVDNFEMVDTLIDDIPPTISHLGLPDTFDLGPFTVSAEFSDGDDIDETTVFLNYRVNGGAYTSVEMTPTIREETFTATADIPAQSQGDVIDYYFEADDVSGNHAESSVYTFEILEIKDYLIWNPDPNETGGLGLAAAMDAAGLEYNLLTALPGNLDLNHFMAVFYCFGIWGSTAGNNYSPDPDDPEILALIDYLNNGGRAYVEGGDTWGFDDVGDVLNPIFGIDSASDGSTMNTNVIPVMGSFTEGLNFTYSGGNSYIDKLIPAAGAYPMFEVDNPGRQELTEEDIAAGKVLDTSGRELSVRVLGNEAGSYRTVASAFEFAGLDDGSVTKVDYLHRILAFFENGGTGANLVGDIESELVAGAGDWNNMDGATMFNDDDGDGVWTLEITPAGSFAWTGGQGYQVLSQWGAWSTQRPNPGGANIHIDFDAGTPVTFYYNTNEDPLWTPSSYHIWDSTMDDAPHTWTIVGPWQGWSAQSVETQCVEEGAGFYYYERQITAFDVEAGLSYAAVRDGAWDFQIAARGYTSDGTGADIPFAANVGDFVRFYVDANMGRVRTEVLPYNLYGDCENELFAAALDFGSEDEMTRFVSDGAGVHTLTATAAEDYAWNAAYQIVPEGIPDAVFPDCTIPIGFNAGDDITFTFVTTADEVDLGWLPAANYVYDSVFQNADLTYYLIGSWTEDEMMMTLTDDGLMMFEEQFTADGEHTYFARATSDDTWDYYLGEHGLSGCAAAINFSVTEGQRIRFFADPMTGRVQTQESPFEGDVLISEFTLDPPQVELVNMTNYELDLTGWNLNGMVLGATRAIIPANGYLVVSDVSLNSVGGTITVLDHREIPLTIHEISYGIAGGAPIPPLGWSTAMVGNTGDYTLDYNLDATPTLGAMNDAAMTAFDGVTVVVNEFKPAENGFIELFNNGMEAVDLSGWTIIADAAYEIPAGRTALAPAGFYTLSQENYPDNMFVDARNIYLLNALGERVFQMGWAHDITAGRSIGLVPDGDLDSNMEFLNEFPSAGGYQCIEPSPNASNGYNLFDPSQITLTVVNDFAGMLILHWSVTDAPDNIVEYKVWKEIDGQFVVIATTVGMHYQDMDVIAGQTYTYALSVVFDESEVVRDEECNLTEPVSGTVSATNAGANLLVHADEATAVNMVAALDAAAFDYARWNLELYGSFADLDLSAFDLLVWEAGLAAADITMYDAPIEEYLAMGGNLFYFAPNLTALPSYYGFVTTGLVPQAAPEMVVGTTVEEFTYTSVVTRDLSFELADAPCALVPLETLHPQYFYLYGNTTDQPLALGNRFRVNEEAAVAEVIFNGFSSASITAPVRVDDFNTYVANALLLFADDTNPVVDYDNIQPPFGAFVSGVMNIEFPVTDPNLAEISLVFGTLEMQPLSRMYRVPVTQTEPTEEDAFGVSYYYDAENQVFHASLNTLVAARQGNNGSSLGSAAFAADKMGLLTGFEANSETAVKSADRDAKSARDARPGEKVRDGEFWLNGTYGYQIQGTDAADNGHVPYQAAFTVDNTLPTIGELIPTDDYILPNTEFSVLVGDNMGVQMLEVMVGPFTFQAMADTPQDAIWFDDEETFGVADVMLDTEDMIWYFTSVNWPDGLHAIMATVYDLAGNMVSTEAADYIVDGTNPMFMVDHFVPLDESSVTASFGVTWPVDEPNMVRMEVEIQRRQTEDDPYADFFDFAVDAGTIRNFHDWGITNVQFDPNFDVENGLGAWMFDLNTLVGDGLIWFDGTYRFTIMAIDGAGNTAEVEIIYQVEQAGVKVFFNPSSGEAEYDETTAMSTKLNIQYAVNLFGYSLEFQFDPNHIQITNITEGGFLGSDGEATTFVKTIDNSQGHFSIANARLSAESGGISQGPDEVGILANITFEATSADAGETLVQALQDVRYFFDPGLQTIESQFIAPYTLTFIEPQMAPWWNSADFNHDNSVDGIDLIGISWAFGSWYTDADNYADNWFINLAGGPFENGEEDADIASLQGPWMEDHRVNSTDLAWFGLNFGLENPNPTTAPAADGLEPTVTQTASADLTLTYDRDQIYQVGDLVTVNVMLDQANIYGADLRITFDPVFELVRVENGGVLSDHVHLLHQVAGHSVHVGLARMTANTESNGAALVRLVFRAVAEGQSIITIEQAKWLDTDFNLDYAANVVTMIPIRQLPTMVNLAQNFPNPFNPATSISYAVPAATPVKLVVYSATGQLVRTLVNETVEAGYYTANWDGANDRGEAVSSGVYFYTLTVGAETHTKKMIMVK